VPRRQAAKAVPARPRARLGPRPLPLHLGIAALTWSSSLGALPRSKTGSPPSNPALAKAAAALGADLEKLEPDAVVRAAGNAARRRMHALLAGIQAYRAHPYRRDLTEPPAVWREGTTRLLDYGGPGHDGMPLLIVPSLINRAYILDLTARTSLLRWLAAQGFQPYLVDWGRPGPDERRFTLTDYTAGRLEAALERVLAAAHRRPLVVGYCMGGLLALALALRRQDDLAGLALLATPWDFHVGQGPQGRLVAASLAAFSRQLEVLGELPVDPIQSLFAALDPIQVIRKFLAFSRFDPASARAVAFVALEDWLNDGVPLAAPVARECLAGWYGANTTAEGRWQVAGRVVAPAELALPSLCLIPAQDRIVPPESAIALADAIPGAARMTPPAGHIGMVASASAPSKVWRPLARWLAARAGS
jgi:polyhydroxyalkanoate synthase